jgi:hypothetical protein
VAPGGKEEWVCQFMAAFCWTHRLMQQQKRGPREKKRPDQANFVVFLSFLRGISLQDLLKQEGWGSVWHSQHLLTRRLRWKGHWGTCSLLSRLRVFPWSQSEAIADCLFLGPHLLSLDCGFNLCPRALVWKTGPYCLLFFIQLFFS